MKIILASGSPRRKELLSTLCDGIVVLPQDVDENINIREPRAFVMALAEKKINGLNFVYKDDLIISADTIVYKDGIFFGKPKSEREAFDMLKELEGKAHFVYTGVCVSYKGKCEVFYDESKVVFKHMTNNQIMEYINTKNPMDKAGAYGIQDQCVVDYYSGSYTNIMGLPMEKVTNKLRELGVI